MKKIKNLFSNLSVEIKELFKKFPLSMILIVIATIVLTIKVGDTEIINDTIFEKCILFLVIWGFGTFFTETFFKKKIGKIMSYAVTGGISLTYVGILFSEMIKNTDYVSVLVRSLVTYILVLFFITIFKTLKNENMNFSEYIIKLFRNLLNCSIVYSILAIGITILLIIFVQLILDGKYGESSLQIHTLLFGLYYVPSILYSISAINKKEVNSFTKKLILFVLLPLVIIAIAIIYIYIAKILITQDMPKNMIFRILAGIFIVAFPVWNIVDYYSNEKPIYKKISKILPILYVPFIFLEIYSIGVRINEFGITPLRYMCIAFVVFQIIAFILTFYKNKEKLEYLYLVMALMSIICIITPLNYEKISIKSQTSIIEKILGDKDFDTLKEEEKSKVKGAYRYLKCIDIENKEKYLPDNLTEENIGKIESYYKIYNNNKIKHFYSQKLLNFEIKKYNNIVKVNGHSNGENKIDFEEANIEVDFSNLILELIEKNKDIAKEYFYENNVITMEDGDFYIEKMSFSYENDDQIEYLSVDGYWLLK